MLRPALPLLIVLALPVVLRADTKLSITFYSDPPGAAIYQSDKLLNYAPAVLEYKAPGRFKDCLKLLPLKIRWVSGAEVIVSDLSACPAQGKKQQFTVFRPNGVPGVEVDAQFAVALLQQRNDAAAARQAAWAAAVAPLAQPRPLNCTSTRIGQQVFTNCY